MFAMYRLQCVRARAALRVDVICAQHTMLPNSHARVRAQCASACAVFSLRQHASVRRCEPLRAPRALPSADHEVVWRGRQRDSAAAQGVRKVRAKLGKERVLQ